MIRDGAGFHRGVGGSDDARRVRNEGMREPDHTVMAAASPASAGMGSTPDSAAGRIRVLVTNPWNGQAYCVVRSLRGHASRVVGTVYREHGAPGRLAPAAVSRFVDRVYPVPLAIDDWRRGTLDEENSATEEAYVRAVLDICERESLDTVFPSWDPEVLVLSRNKSRLAERGITVPVPEWPVLQRAMDKHALVRAATAMGFPCPRTYLPGSPEEAVDLAKRLGYPVVVKPRFSVRGRGSGLVTDPAKLEETVRRVQPTFGMPILQEWIPGRARPARQRGRHPGSHGPPDHGARAPASADGAEIVRLASLRPGVLHGDARGGRRHPPPARPGLRGPRPRAGQGGPPGRRGQADGDQLPSRLPHLVRARGGPARPSAVRADPPGPSGRPDAAPRWPGRLPQPHRGRGVSRRAPPGLDAAADRAAGERSGRSSGSRRPGRSSGSTARRTGPRGSTSTGTSGRWPTIRWPRSRGMPPISWARAEPSGWRRRHGSSVGRRGESENQRRVVGPLRPRPGGRPRRGDCRWPRRITRASTATRRSASW